MAKPLIPVVLYRDEWLLMLGWIVAKQPEGEWEPMFVSKTTAAIKDAVDAHDARAEEAHDRAGEAWAEGHYQPGVSDPADVTEGGA